MDTKIVRLADSTLVGTRLYPTLKWVLNGSKNSAPIRFYMGIKQVLRKTLKGFMWDMKLFHVYGLKRVLSRSYPALRRFLYVHNRVMYGKRHCCARLF